MVRDVDILISCKIMSSSQALPQRQTWTRTLAGNCLIMRVGLGGAWKVQCVSASARTRLDGTALRAQPRGHSRTTRPSP